MTTSLDWTGLVLLSISLDLSGSHYPTNYARPYGEPYRSTLRFLIVTFRLRPAQFSVAGLFLCVNETKLQCNRSVPDFPG